MYFIPQFKVDDLFPDSQQMQQGVSEAVEELAVTLDSNFDVMQNQWQRLAAATVLQRRRLGYGPTPILIRPGPEGGKVRKEATANRDYSQPAALTFQGAVFTDDVIAVALNNGSPKHNLPPRPFYTLSDEQKKAQDEFNQKLVYRLLMRRK